MDGSLLRRQARRRPVRRRGHPGPGDRVLPDLHRSRRGPAVLRPLHRDRATGGVESFLDFSALRGARRQFIQAGRRRCAWESGIPRRWEGEQRGGGRLQRPRRRCTRRAPRRPRRRGGLARRTGRPSSMSTDFLYWLALNAVIRDWDVYRRMSHNYYMYADPADGARFPGGFRGTTPSRSTQGGRGSGARGCLAMDEIGEWPRSASSSTIRCTAERYLRFVEQAAASEYTPSTMGPHFAAAHALIAPYVVGAAGLSGRVHVHHLRGGLHGDPGRSCSRTSSSASGTSPSSSRPERHRNASSPRDLLETLAGFRGLAGGRSCAVGRGGFAGLRCRLVGSRHCAQQLRRGLVADELRERERSLAVIVRDARVRAQREEEARVPPPPRSASRPGREGGTV